MKKPYIKECLDENNNHAFWYLVTDDNQDLLWSENKEHYNTFKLKSKPTPIPQEEIEKMAIDKIKDKWSHLFIVNAIPVRPNPTNFWNEVDMVMLGMYKCAELNAGKESDAISFADFITDTCMLIDTLPKGVWLFVDSDSERHRLTSKELYGHYLNYVAIQSLKPKT